MSKISEQVSQVQTISMSLDAALVNQRNVLERIEKYSMTSLQSSNDSLPSLGSITSSFSKHETALPTTDCSRLSLNDLIRSGRSQRSLNRLGMNSIDDISVGTGKRLVCECHIEPQQQAPTDGKDLSVYYVYDSSTRLIVGLLDTSVWRNLGKLNMINKVAETWSCRTIKPHFASFAVSHGQLAR